jgi:hypothetical protein
MRWRNVTLRLFMRHPKGRARLRAVPHAAQDSSTRRYGATSTVADRAGTATGLGSLFLDAKARMTMCQDGTAEAAAERLNSHTSAAEAVFISKAVNAALKRCSTQNHSYSPVCEAVPLPKFLAVMNNHGSGPAAEPLERMQACR